MLSIEVELNNRFIGCTGSYGHDEAGSQSFRQLLG